MAAIDSAFHGSLSRPRPSCVVSITGKISAHGFLPSGSLVSNRSWPVVLPDSTAPPTSANFCQFSHKLLVDISILSRACCEKAGAGVLSVELPIKIAVNCFFGAVDEMVTAWVALRKDRRSAFQRSPISAAISCCGMGTEQTPWHSTLADFSLPVWVRSRRMCLQKRPEAGRSSPHDSITLWWSPFARALNNGASGGRSDRDSQLKKKSP